MATPLHVDRPQVVKIAHNRDAVAERYPIGGALPLRINAHHRDRLAIRTDNKITNVKVAYRYPSARSEHWSTCLQRLARARWRRHQHRAALRQMLRRLDLERIQRERLGGGKLLDERPRLGREVRGGLGRLLPAGGALRPAAIAAATSGWCAGRLGGRAGPPALGALWWALCPRAWRPGCGVVLTAISRAHRSAADLLLRARSRSSRRSRTSLGSSTCTRSGATRTRTGVRVRISPSSVTSTSLGVSITADLAE